AHERNQLGQALVMRRRVEHLLRSASSGRTTGLYRLDLTVIDATFPDVIDERFEGSAERHLHEARIANLANQRKDLGPRTLRASSLAEPCRTLGHDGCDVVPRLDVVNVRRLTPESLLSWKRRSWTRTTGLPLERRDQSSFFSANECACSFHEFDIEVKAAPENVVAQHPVFSRLLDRAGE